MRFFLPPTLLVATLALSGPSLAQENDNPLLAPEAARSAILGCLARVDAEGAAISSESTDAKWAALRRPSDCIGVASDPCQKDNDYTTYAMRMCISAEAQAWEMLMDEWQDALLVGATAEERRVVEGSQATWARAVEESVEYYDVQFRQNEGGTIWPVLAVGDWMTMTAHRALWLRSLSPG